jgi:hypothetical protein
VLMVAASGRRGRDADRRDEAGALSLHRRQRYGPDVIRRGKISATDAVVARL